MTRRPRRPTWAEARAILRQVAHVARTCSAARVGRSVQNPHVTLKACHDIQAWLDEVVVVLRRRGGRA
jgi:hypothetical protein